MRAELQNIPEAWPGEPTWFWHGEQILALVEQYKPVNCVELGSWKGGSAIATARVIGKWGGKITCVDVWGSVPVPYGCNHSVTVDEFVRNVTGAGVFNVRAIQSRTDDAAREWRGGPIDYLYVDADHSYEGCKSDLELWWPHIRIGGLIAGDDYDDPRFGVTAAWDEFEKKYAQVFEHKATPGTNPECTRLVWGIKR